ncbi:MAG TPA: vanadium-dependent haloperoxidase [Candidatus Babeliales bacterium]|nr:vanadium-dependent haloperoxidase [Candidatus Babeliales bacterium]
MKFLPIIFFMTLVLPNVYLGANQHGFWNKSDLFKRKNHAKKLRIATAVRQKHATKIVNQNTNGDLQRYKDKRGSYSKALFHQPNGMVNNHSFESMIKALKSAKSNNFDTIVLGGVRHLQDPQAAYAYALEGADAAAYTIKKAPKLTSAQAASEMVELYWGVLLRDIPFNQYATDLTAVAAIANLNALSHFQGPRINGAVTSQTLWRGATAGDLVGPYISQFLYQAIPDHGKKVEQLYYPYLSGTLHNFLTAVSDFLLVQNGGVTGKINDFQASPNYIFTGRDLGTYVHKDYSTEAWINAALILLSYGTAALDENNPYKANMTQDGFVTYGQAKVIELINIAAAAALKATWYQKWLVHLRLRPESFGFLVQRQLIDGRDSEISNALINSPVLPIIFGLYGTYLLPQMYPEGSPNHPSYPAGHAAIAGACATILKAFFNENFVIPNPVQPNVTNTGFDPYEEALYVGDELNKLASNIGMGRDFAGVHYRSDCFEGMKLGEKIALSVLVDEGYTNNEKFKGYIVTKFNGKTITVGAKVFV